MNGYSLDTMIIVWNNLSPNIWTRKTMELTS